MSMTRLWLIPLCVMVLTGPAEGKQHRSKAVLHQFREIASGLRWPTMGGTRQIVRGYGLRPSAIVAGTG